MSDIIRVEFPPRLMTREIAAYYIGGNLRDVDALREKNEITPVGDSKRIKYRREDIDRVIDAMKERPTSRGGA